MCGIVGIKIFGSAPAKGEQMRVENALPTQCHRGPDHSNTLVTGNTVLGHNRLAVIDTKDRSNQPFTDASGRYSIVFNGEIYNYQALKNDLLKNDYQFQTSSDTEVLLYHLIQNGTGGISALEGCFAFAFYDAKEDDLILARDRMGIKPLLFSIDEGQISFASELNAFKWLIDEHSIDEVALSHYFRFTYVPAPKTMLRQVQKLMPGHYLNVKGGDFDILNYQAAIEKPAEFEDYSTAKRELRQKVEHAVISRMNADVPLGTFLSGGVDSSIVSAIAADFKTELATFSIGFEEHEFYDESKYARMVAEHIGSNHHAITLSNDIVTSELPHILNTFDEPFADSSAIAMFFLSQKATQHLTVCLSGDGADELFAGYNKHRAFLKTKSPGFLLNAATKLVDGNKKGARSSWWSNKMRQLQKFKKLQSLDWPENYWFLASFIDEADYKALLKTARFELPSFEEKDSLNTFLKMDQAYVLPNDMLKKVDLMSMANSLEVRVPFLDTAVVALANAIPAAWKNDGKISKKILKDAFSDVLPDEVFNRSKKGFEVPLTTWLVQAWESVVRPEWFDSAYLQQQNLFHEGGVKELKATLFSKEPNESAIQMWAYIVFQNWYDRWSEKLK
ncbi:MAG: asparagine synthase (glutamine-hydrolyzing) [Bacteroidota bacterium]